MFLAELTIIFAIVFALSCLVYLLVMYKERNFTNPFFWLLTLSFLYFCIPSAFVKDIRFFYDWYFTDESIIYSHYMVSIFMFAFSFSALVFMKPCNLIAEPVRLSNVTKGLWRFAFCYALFVLFYKIYSGTLIVYFDYEGTHDTFKLKNLSYLMITVSVFYYVSERKFIAFLPNLLIVLIDLLAGSRTTAAIAIMPMVLSVTLLNKKLYLIPLAALFCLMLLLGILRSSFLPSDGTIPSYIKAMGEFRETYVTLPIFLLDENAFVGKGQIEDISGAFVLALAQPIRTLILDSTVLPGPYAAQMIGRGYGLASNLITSSFFYGYFILPVTLVGILLVCFVAKNLLRRLNPSYFISFLSFFVIFLRLAIREGLFMNVGLLIWLLMVYYLPIVFINKYSLFRQKIV